jgi:hypothetical protein
MDMTINAPLRLKRRTARLLSVLVLVALPLGYIGGAMLPDAGAADARPFAIIRLIGLFATLALFIDIRSQRINAPDAMLDERERAERDSAYRAGYHGIVAMIFAALSYAVFAQKFGGWLPDRDGAIDLLSALGFAGLALPGSIAAWRERSIED